MMAGNVDVEEAAGRFTADTYEKHDDGVLTELGLIQREGDTWALRNAMLAELSREPITPEALKAHGWELVPSGFFEHPQHEGWWARSSKGALTFSPPGGAVIPLCLKPKTMGQLRTLLRLSQPATGE